MGGNEIVKICYNFQVRNNKNYMNRAALVKHELRSIDYAEEEDPVSTMLKCSKTKL
jgi:hypothetical protein